MGCTVGVGLVLLCLVLLSSSLADVAVPEAVVEERLLTAVATAMVCVTMGKDQSE